MKHEEFKPMRAKIARYVLRKDNILDHYEELIEGYLMKLPPYVLDYVEYNDFFSGLYTEFSVRMLYLQSHPDLSCEEKREIISKCDLKKLDETELESLQALLISIDTEMIERLKKRRRTMEQDKE